MLQRMLTNMLNRWAWLVIALFLAVTVQPCPHDSGENCLHISQNCIHPNKKQHARSFGLFDVELKPQALDAPHNQSLAYDSLSDRNQSFVPVGLP